MSDTQIYVSRLVRLPLTDSEGVPVGRIDDVIVAPAGLRHPPRVMGFVAGVQRRRIFVNIHRVEEIGPGGVRLHGGVVDLRRFQLRNGEVLVRSGLLDRHVGGEIVNDLALQPTPGEAGEWEVASVSLSSGGLLRRRRAGRLAAWTEVASLFSADAMTQQVADMREMHPADVAERIAAMPLERRRALAEAMDDERLADLLEELPEDEQRRLIESLDLHRAAHVLEEMEADDAVDLLAELPAGEREELLGAMEPGDARDLRRLLRYQGDTAGGLMTPDPLIVSGDTTVAEALARLRISEVAAATAAHVFVVDPPTETPTGRYLGNVGFQRLLREPPSTPISQCMDDEPAPISPDLPDADVARRLAAYDAVALPVCDSAGRLVGAVTVDDVLDRVLPEGWRRRVR